MCTPNRWGHGSAIDGGRGEWPSLKMLNLEKGSGWGLLHASSGDNHGALCAGIDVSLESASLCVVDATGRIVREAKVAG